MNTPSTLDQWLQDEQRLKVRDRVWPAPGSSPEKPAWRSCRPCSKSPDVPRVRAEGVVLHCGRQLATAEARLTGPDGKLYAHATTTCLVFDLPGM